MRPIAWFSPVRELPFGKFCVYVLGGITLLLLMSDYANAATSDLPTVLRNLRRVIKPLTVLILACSFTMGVFFILKGILMMKKFGVIAHGQAQPGDLGGPLTYLIIGAILLYLPTSTDILMNSIFGSTKSIFGGGGINYQELGTGQTLLGYTGSSTLERQWADLANTLVLFIQLLGFLSFLKGWLIMSKIATPGGSQQGGVAKGLTHIIGGVVAINFVGVVKILKNTIYGS